MRSSRHFHSDSLGKSSVHDSMSAYPTMKEAVNMTARLQGVAPITVNIVGSPYSAVNMELPHCHGCSCYFHHSNCRNIKNEDVHNGTGPYRLSDQERSTDRWSFMSDCKHCTKQWKACTSSNCSCNYEESKSVGVTPQQSCKHQRINSPQGRKQLCSLPCDLETDHESSEKICTGTQEFLQSTPKQSKTSVVVKVRNTPQYIKNTTQFYMTKESRKSRKGTLNMKGKFPKILPSKDLRQHYLMSLGCNNTLYW